MLSIDEVQNVLDDIVDNIPVEILDGLNGGIILLPDEKLHPKNVDRDLYILGEYHNDAGALGRYVVIYYGSFVRVHGYLADEQFKEKLKKTLYHELIHHLENRAGDKSLEIQDEFDIAEYLKRKGEG